MTMETIEDLKQRFARYFALGKMPRNFLPIKIDKVMKFHEENGYLIDMPTICFNVKKAGVSIRGNVDCFLVYNAHSLHLHEDDGAGFLTCYFDYESLFGSKPPWEAQNWQDDHRIHQCEILIYNPNDACIKIAHFSCEKEIVVAQLSFFPGVEVCDYYVWALYFFWE